MIWRIDEKNILIKDISVIITNLCYNIIGQNFIEKCIIEVGR